MRRELLNRKQLIGLFAVYQSGSYLGIAGSEARQDVWMALLIAIAFSFGLLLLYARIAALHPDKHLFDIVFDTLGKPLGFLFSLLFILFFLGVAAVGLFTYNEAAHILSLEKTPLLFLMAVFLIFTVWSLHAGLRVLGRLSSLLLFFVVLIIAGTVLLSIPEMSLESIQPVAQQPPRKILKNALYFFICPLGESLVFLSLLGHLPKTDSKYKAALRGGGLGMALLLTALLRDLLVLGTPTYIESYFPAHNAVGVINIGGFIQRVEVVASFSLFLCTFVKMCQSLNAACQGCVKLTGAKNPRLVLFPLAVFLCAAGVFITRINIRFFEAVANVLIYFLPVQVFIPLLIWIVSEIKARKAAEPAA